MKFEQFLHIYWSRSFLYGGKTITFNKTISTLFNSLNGLAHKTRFLFIKRFEFKLMLENRTASLNSLHIEEKKAINLFLSKLLNINSNIFKWTYYNLIRLYMNRSKKGKAQALGKPSRGQRTWSNAQTSYILNTTIRRFVNNIKKTYNLKPTIEKKNFKVVQKKKKRSKKGLIIKPPKKSTVIWF